MSAVPAVVSRSSEVRSWGAGIFRPRRYQAAIIQAPQRWQVVVAHRRAGKSVGLVNMGLGGTVMCPYPEPIVAYIAPTQRMAKMIAWRYATQYARPLTGFRPNKGELEVSHTFTQTATRATLRLLGSEQPERLRGQYLDGAIVDEAAFHKDPAMIQEVLIPALMDRQGWLVVAGTPYGANQLKRYFESARDHAPGFEGWKAWMLKASETGAIPQRELDLARAVMSRQQYEQEFECSFEAVIEGAFYGESMQLADLEERIGAVPFDAALPLMASCDLGMRDAFSVWLLQEHPTANQLRAVGFLEYTGKSIPAVKGEVAKACALWGMPEPQLWVMPHDIQVRELGTGRARIEVARECGMNVQPAVNLPLVDGIEAVRALLPAMWFDRSRCGRGLDALRQYRAEVDHKLETQRAVPVHDWTSHGADALRTYATTRAPNRRSDWDQDIRLIGQSDVEQPGAMRRRRA